MPEPLTPTERSEIAHHMGTGKSLPWVLADRLLDLVEALEGRSFTAATTRNH